MEIEVMILIFRVQNILRRKINNNPKSGPMFNRIKSDKGRYNYPDGKAAVLEPLY